MKLSIGDFCEKIRIWGIKGIVDYFRTKHRNAGLRRFFLKDAAEFQLAPKRGITIVADVSSRPSLSKTMRDFIGCLKAANIPYQVYDLGEGNNSIPEEDLNGIVTPRSEFHILKYDHVVEMFTHVVPQELPIANSCIVFWEFNSGLKEYYPALGDGRGLVAMSDFCEEVLHSEFPMTRMISKIRYPFLFDVGSIPSVDVMRAKLNLKKDDFVVFFNFDYGSSYGRKNPNGVAQAFAKAFINVSSAKLVFKTKGATIYPQKARELADTCEQLGISDRVIFVNDYLSQAELYALTQVCDVYISLHRGEGFGLGIAEAMSFGKAVVVTNYSATTEFCNSENSIPIPFQLVDVPQNMNDNPCYANVSSWAEPNIDAAAIALRRLYDEPSLRARLGENARDFMRDHFSLDNFRASIERFLASTSPRNHQ